MDLEGGHRNSVIKRRNPIEFGLVFNDAKERCREAFDEREGCETAVAEMDCAQAKVAPDLDKNKACPQRTGPV
ncbi:hypothetical protein EVAR_24862_1 [Eumeta japonica]|uniref:Uncharacterized protein n=1 Tax=Eumeta variegata TaxID=151549 RepID=A0A4C1YBH3_EUMVA|nr:hypothetical protein EVAR_24862_1 [Eumeta japonica]